MIRAVVIAVVVMFTAVASADERESFYQGVALDRDGKPGEAVKVYLDLVERAPADPFADDALIELGRVYEEKLSDPIKAAEAYERLLREHPTSRLAVRAKKRAEFLRGAMGEGGKSAAQLAELNDILYGMAKRPRADSIARMEKLVAEHPDFPAAARAVFWLGERHQEDGRLDAALARFHEVVERFPRSEWEPRARKAIGDVHLARGEYDAAMAAYRTLRGRGDQQLELVAEESMKRARDEQWRWRAYVASWIVIGLFPIVMIVLLRRATKSWRETGRALIRPPVEAIYFLPVAALFVGAGMTEHAALGNAIETIVLGGVVVVWLSGASLRAAGATVARALGHAAASAVAVVALCYLAVHRERLIDMLIETIRFGSEKH